VFLLELVYPLHHLLISLPCTLNMVEVVVVAAALEEDVAHLAHDTIFLMADRVLLIRSLRTVSSVNGVITFLVLGEVWSI